MEKSNQRCQIKHENLKRTYKENLPLSSLSSIFDSNAAHLFKPRLTAEAC